MPRWLTYLLLALILVIAALARSAYINRYSYFFDEAWNDELSTARGSLHIRLANDVLYQEVPKPTSLSGAPAWWRIWANMDHVTHPPMYIIVLRGWRDVFGESPIVSRACSATFSVIAILLLFDISRLLHGNAAALWACLIMALAGAQIELAQEVRPYAVLLAVSMGAISALVRIEKLGPTTPRLIALCACAAAMVLTHYFAAPAALALGAYVLMRLRGKARRNAMIALLIAAGIFITSWGPFLWQQRANFAATADNWLKESRDGHALLSLKRLSAIPFRLLMEPPNPKQPLPGYVSSVALVLPFLLLRRRPDLLLWCIWLGGTIFFIALLDLTRSTQHLVYIRYSLLGGPALYATLAAVVQSKTRAWRAHLIPAAVALACLGALPTAYEQPKPEYRVLASYIDNNVQPGDAVVFYSSDGDEWFSSAMYLNTCYYSRAYPWPFVMMTHPPDESMRDSLSHFDHIWLINRTASMRGEKLLPGAAVDGYQYFPFTGACERITPDAARSLSRTIVPAKPLWELR